MSDYERVIYEKRDHVATVTFNNPEKLNAMDLKMHEELEEVFRDVQRDSGVHVMLLTGAGRGFCSGFDVRNFRPDSHEERMAAKGEQRYYRQPQPSSPMPRIMHNTVRKPVVSAINGIAAGAGYGMAMASDIRIASTAASFSHVYLRRALIPSAELWWLQRLVGIGMARHLLLTNKDIDAEEALRIGLITGLSEPDELMDDAREIVESIAAGPPVATQWAKVLMDRALDLSYDDTQYLSGLARDLAQPAGEFAEGVRSFLEKRAPEFTAE
ncbi:MAG: enoyl-CoA hydratase/isomerase family protein [Dehalococcoidia bacterium]